MDNQPSKKSIIDINKDNKVSKHNSKQKALKVLNYLIPSLVGSIATTGVVLGITLPIIAIKDKQQPIEFKSSKYTYVCVDSDQILVDVELSTMPKNNQIIISLDSSQTEMPLKYNVQISGPHTLESQKFQIPIKITKTTSDESCASIFKLNFTYIHPYTGNKIIAQKSYCCSYGKPIEILSSYFKAKSSIDRTYSVSIDIKKINYNLISSFENINCSIKENSLTSIIESIDNVIFKKTDLSVPQATLKFDFKLKQDIEEQSDITFDLEFSPKEKTNKDFWDTFKIVETVYKQ